ACTALHLELRVRLLERGDQLVLLGQVRLADVEILLGLRVGHGFWLALTRRAHQSHDRSRGEDEPMENVGCTRHCSLSCPLDATGSPGRMPPGGSISSRTMLPRVTCWTTMRSTRVGSTRLYRAVVPRGPGRVAKPVPIVGVGSVRISLTNTFGPCVQRPKQ